jgi:hypothetical protein
MKSREVGSRVGAIQKADEDTVWLYGYGTYDGYMEHPEHGLVNARITLDDGKIVWGFECWWGPEESIKELIGDREAVPAALSGEEAK